MKDLSAFLNSLWLLVRSQTAKDSAIVLSGNLLFSLCAFLFTIIVVRQLNVADFGIFSAWLSFVLLVADLAELGIGSSLSSFLPRMKAEGEQEQSFIGAALTTQTMFVSILAGSVYVAASPLAQLLFHNKTYTSLLHISALGIFFSVITNFSQYTLAARQRFLTNAILTTLVGLLRVVLVAGLLMSTAFSLTTLIWAQVGTFALIAVIGVLLLRLSDTSLVISMATIKKLLSFSWYLGITKAITSASGRLDILLLTILSTTTDVGFYASALRMVAVFSMVAGSITTVLAPKFAGISTHQQMRQYLKKVAFVITGVAIVIGGMILLAPLGISIVFGVKSLPAVPTLQLLLLGTIFSIATIPLSTMATYYFQKPKITTGIGMLHFAILLLGNIVLIPVWGRIGTAVSVMTAQGCTFFLTAYFLHRMYHSNVHPEGNR